MTSDAELVLLRDGSPLRSVPVAPRVVLGRSPANDLVLADEDVSKHHAVVSLDGGTLRVADLRSTNGTWVNDRRVEECELRDGDRLRLGPGVELLVRVSGAAAALPLVHDLDAGIRYTFDTDRLHVGAGEDCTIRIDGPARAATLLVDPDGTIWLGRDGATEVLVAGLPFQVGGRRLVLEPATAAASPTVKSAARTRYPYRLHATLDGPGGAVATVQHLRRPVVHQVTSENRAVLLYVLARQLRDDLQGAHAPAAAGWCDDAVVVTGVWGRSAAGQSPSSLNVLVHRVRKELEEAGLDPWCIEKRRGATRVRVDEVEL